MPDHLPSHALQLLTGFSTLKENWDEAGASAPDQQAIGRARNLVQFLSRAGQPVFHIAPGPNGEVMIDIRKGHRSLEVLFYPDKTRYVKFPETGMPEQGDFQIEELSNLLSWVNG